MAKGPERPAQPDEPDRNPDEMGEETTFGGGADDVRGIAEDEDEDEFDDLDDPEGEEEEGR